MAYMLSCIGAHFRAACLPEILSHRRLLAWRPNQGPPVVSLLSPLPKFPTCLEAKNTREIEGRELNCAAVED